MNRQLKTAMLVFLSGLALSVTAGAFTFQEDLFTMEIPEGDHTYYYTHKGTNMTGTMLENAEKQDMLCLIGVYSEGGTLQYTFKAERREGSCADVAAALPGELSGSYELGGPEAETIADRYGVSLSGRNLQSDNYLVKIYVSGDDPAVVFTTMYTPEAEHDLRALLTTVEWPPSELERDPDAVPLPGAETPDEEPVPEAPAELEPIEDTEETETPAAQAPAGTWDTVREKLAELTDFAKEHWKELTVGAAGIVLLAVLTAALKKPRYRPKHAKK